MKEIEDFTEAPNSEPSSYWLMEVKGFSLLTLVVLLVVSLYSFDGSRLNPLGLFGFVTGRAMHFLFGMASYVIVGYLAWLSYRFISCRPVTSLLQTTLKFSLFIVSFCILSNLLEGVFPLLRIAGGKLYVQAMTASKFHLGGAPFYYLYHDLPYLNLSRILNTVGTAIVFSSTLLASVILLTETRLLDLLKWIKKDKEEKGLSLFRDHEIEAENTKLASCLAWLRTVGERWRTKKDVDVYEETFEDNYEEVESFEEPAPLQPALLVHEEEDGSLPEVREMNASSPKEAKIVAMLERVSARKDIDYSNFRIPSLSALTPAKKVDQTRLKKGLQKQAELLEETLLNFGIEAKVGMINCGPTITSIEVHPAVGVKVQKIKALESDIALNLKARSLRIIAPIPGKAAVGIELPNPDPQEVGFKDLLASYQKKSKKFQIPILLGKAVNGEYVMNDLAKMPHCIIAGATGSGKSVCINTIVMSIVMNAKPDEIKLLMVDPKQVELAPYTNLPHMIAPVITEPQEACAALNWLVKEMEERYDLLKHVGVRNILSYNERKPKKDIEKALSIELGRAIPKKMPYIVGIIDELADLMMVASQDIETPIARIAQMARAVGIHLILATQRPSREVITGIIKANFPTRIAFKVASRINSQIILDDTGAESLLGNGDMLFLPPGTATLVRVQGAYIRDEDINKIVDQICRNAPPNYLIKSFEGSALAPSQGSRFEANNERDALYNEAYEVIIKTGNASTTFLQRKLKIGYARAASLIDQLEEDKVVGPAETAGKGRKILVKRDWEDEEL
jgi:S-DNA-T family DNA segregation ATPase FtsK/SpoIIIE